MLNPSDNNSKEERKELAKSFFSSWWTDVQNWFRELIDIDHDADIEGTIKFVHTNRKMIGTNVWMLIASIIIASIGLQSESVAVIIGAMLISPLMSPILGVGMGIGINDKDMLWDSLLHLGASFIVALLTSYLFFYCSPFASADSINDQILSRTEPHFYDLLIAFFGGIAGVVSISRKDKSNAIPGVAIATALMPPVCVAGFGLAIHSLDIFIKAFYLFFMNCVFIALATYLIVRFLRFPYRSWINKKERTVSYIYIGLFVLVTAIPSFIFLASTVKEIRVQSEVNKYVSDQFPLNSDYIVEKEFQALNDSTSQLYLKLTTEVSIDTNIINEKKQKFSDYKVGGTQLKIVQDVVSQQELIELKHESEVQHQTLMDNHHLEMQDKDEEIETLKAQLLAIKADTISKLALTREMKAFYPEISDVNFSRVTNDSTYSIITLLTWDKKVRNVNKTSYENRLKKFLSTKFEGREVRIIRN